MLLRCEHGRHPWTVGVWQSLPKNKRPKFAACVLRLPSNGLVVCFLVIVTRMPKFAEAGAEDFWIGVHGLQRTAPALGCASSVMEVFPKIVDKRGYRKINRNFVYKFTHVLF